MMLKICQNCGDWSTEREVLGWWTVDGVNLEVCPVCVPTVQKGTYIYEKVQTWIWK